MKVIIITYPTPQANEVEVIKEALDIGAYKVHLRRPQWSCDETRKLLDQLPDTVLHHIVLHDYHQLIHEYPISGLHYNQRNPLPKDFPNHNTKYSKSLSCHSLQEIRINKEHLDYLFLSPIFNSISKPSYHTGYTLEELQNASQDIIDHKVFALGGINKERLPIISTIPFGGVALLGAFWESVPQGNYRSLLQSIIND